MSWNFQPLLPAAAASAAGVTESSSRLSHKIIPSKAAIARLASIAIAQKHSINRLAGGVFFVPTTIYRPTGDGYKVGTFGIQPTSPTTYYDKVDDASADDLTTYVKQARTDWVDDDEILFTFTSAGQIPIGSGIKVWARISATGNWPSSATILFVIRKNGVDYSSYPYQPSTDALGGWTNPSYLFNSPPWGGQDWGTAADFEVGIRLTNYNETVSDFRITQLYYEVIRNEATARASHKAVPQYFRSGRLSNSLAFPEYNPTQWDSSYLRRAPLSFGSDHSELPVGYTAAFQIQTGNEIKVPYNYGQTSGNGVGNESIQHSSRQIAYFNNSLYLVWLAVIPNQLYFEIWIKRYYLLTNSWAQAKKIATTTTDSDTHQAPCVLIDDAGYIHVFYGCHNSPIKYRKSSYAENINIWGSEVELGTGGAFTYPRPIKDASGNLYVFARGDGTSKFGFFKSTDGGLTWGSWQVVIDYSTQYVYAPSVYCGGCVYQDGRVHLVVTFWDGYGTYNKGRAIAYLYSDDFVTWKEANGTTVGTTGSDPVNFNDITKVISSPTPFPDTAPWYHTNSEALCVDVNKRPYFLFQDWYNIIGEECNLWLAKWNGSNWSTINLSGLTNAKKMWRYRNGAVLYIDREDIYVYSFVKPTGEIYFGGEIYRWRGTDFGTNWSYDYLSANTSIGIGMMSVLPSIPTGYNKYVFLCRGRDLYLFEDILYPYIRNDGADVRIIRTIKNGDGSYSHTEHDRLPDRWNAEDSIVYFKTDIVVPANAPHPHAFNRYWVYYNKYNASNPPRDVADVFILHEGFEAYNTGSDLNGQGGWSGNSGFATVIAYDDTATWSAAHTNKLWDGAKFLYMWTNASSNIRKSLALSSHVFEAWFWLESSYVGMPYIEIYDSSSAKYIRLGVGQNYFTYKKDNGSWTNSTIPVFTNRYLPLKIIVNSSGVSLYAENQAVLTNDSYMTSSSHIGLGVDPDYYGEGAGVDTCVDAIRIYKYVSNSEEMSIGEVEGSEYSGTSRLSHKTTPQVIETRRLSHDIGNLQFSDKKRLSEKADVSKMEIARLSELITADKTLTERIAEALTPHKVITTREAHTLTLEAQKLQRVAHFLATDKTLTARMMSSLSLDKTDIARIAESLSLDKTSVIRLMNLSVLDKNDIQRISQTLNLHYLLVIRICHALAVDKVMTVRLAQLPPTAIVGVERLSETLTLEKQIFERLHHSFVPDKTLVSRVAQYLATDKHITARLASLLNLEDEDTVRIAEAILTDKTLVVRLSHDLEPDKAIVIRISEVVPLEAEATARLAAWCALDAQKFLRIAELLSLDKTTTARLSHDLEFAGAETIRLAELVSLDKITTIRIPETVPVDKLILIRLAMKVPGNKTLTTKIAEYISIEATGTERLSETLLTDKTVIERIANGLLLRYVKTVRLCQTIVLDKYLSSRYAHRVPIYFRDLFGMYITGQDLETLQLVDYGLSTLSFSGAAIENLRLTSPSINNLSIVDANIKRIRIINADII